MGDIHALNFELYFFSLQLGQVKEFESCVAASQEIRENTQS